MRRADLDAFADSVAGPIERFAGESRVSLVLLINDSGQVLAQRGFARALDVMGVATLAAGIHASSRALADLLGEKTFSHLHQGGVRQQVFIGAFDTPAEELVLVAVFGEESSVGLVRIFFAGLAREVAELPGWRHLRPTTDAMRFERELESGLERFFGAV